MGNTCHSDTKHGERKWNTLDGVGSQCVGCSRRVGGSGLCLQPLAGILLKDQRRSPSWGRKRRRGQKEDYEQSVYRPPSDDGQRKVTTCHFVSQGGSCPDRESSMNHLRVVSLLWSKQRRKWPSDYPDSLSPCDVVVHSRRLLKTLPDSSRCLPLGGWVEASVEGIRERFRKQIEEVTILRQGDGSMKSCHFSRDKTV